MNQENNSMVSTDCCSLQAGHLEEFEFEKPVDPKVSQDETDPESLSFVTLFIHLFDGI